MGYILDSDSEYSRLEKQANYSLYDIDREYTNLSEIGFDLGAVRKNVLDLGCGSGYVSRFMKRKRPELNFTGVDLCQSNIKNAQRLALAENLDINFMQTNFLDLDPKDNYDLIYSRYMLEHTSNPQEIVNQIYQKLNPSGEAVLIDLDVLLYNLVTDNNFINESLNLISRSLEVDCYCGRKLYSFAMKAGFKNVRIHSEVLPLLAETLEEEVDLYRDRFENGKVHLKSILGSEFTYERFVREYLAEMINPLNFMFYNKFIVRGVK